MNNYKIEHEEIDNKGSFNLMDQGSKIGEMGYYKREEVIVIQHTSVDDHYQGKGLAKLLVEHSVEWARNNNLKILPQCSYARMVLQRNPDFEDVLK